MFRVLCFKLQKGTEDPELPWLQAGPVQPGALKSSEGFSQPCSLANLDNALFRTWKLTAECAWLPRHCTRLQLPSSGSAQSSEVKWHSTQLPKSVWVENYSYGNELGAWVRTKFIDSFVNLACSDLYRRPLRLHGLWGLCVQPFHSVLINTERNNTSITRENRYSEDLPLGMLARFFIHIFLLFCVGFSISIKQFKKQLFQEKFEAAIQQYYFVSKDSVCSRSAEQNTWDHRFFTWLQVSCTLLCTSFLHKFRNIFLLISSIKCLSLCLVFVSLAMDTVLLGNTISLNRNSSCLATIVDKL